MKNRNRAYYRHHRERVIDRKRSIIKHGFWHVPHEQYGRLAKGKIHCSCPSCSSKTRHWGLPKAQKVRLDSMGEQIEFWK